MKKYLLLLLILSLFACWPFFKKGYFESHDGEWMVIRFSAFHQTLAAGQFPVRFVDRLNNNYGYPVLNFLYPLPFYLAEMPKALGFGFVDSIKITFVTATVASVVAMFWALSQIVRPAASFAGAIVYLFIPYRFVDLYVRGSLGENVAFVFVPIVAGSILKIAANEDVRYKILLSASTAALILSHNVIAAITLPFILIWAFLTLGKGVMHLAVPLILGFLMSAFFWVPALYDLQFVRLSQIKVSEISAYLVDLPKLIIPAWGYGPNPSSPGGLSPQIGIVALFIIVSAAFILLKTKKDSKVIAYFLLVLFLIIFANTKQSQALWQILPGADVIQFPFRLHSVTILAISLLTVYAIQNAKKKIIPVALVVAASIVSTIAYTQPAAFTNKGDGFYATNEDTTNVRDEYLPIWANVKPKDRAVEKIELKGPGQITSKTIQAANYFVTIETHQNTKVQVNTIYFPGWKVKVDGSEARIDYQNPMGLITFELSPGIHEVIISYGRSPVHLASEVISALALLSVGGYFFISWRKQNSK